MSVVGEQVPASYRMIAIFTSKLNSTDYVIECMSKVRGATRDGSKVQLTVYMDHLGNNYSGRPAVFGPFGLEEAKNAVVNMVELMTPRAQRNMALQSEMYKELYSDKK